MDGHEIARLARKYRCEIEFFSTAEKGYMLSSQKKEVHSKDANFTSGFAVRTIRNKRLGFYPFESAAEAESAVRRALKLGELQEKAEYYFSGENGKSGKYYDRKCTNFQNWGIEELEGMLDMHERQKVESVQNLIGATASTDLLIGSEGGMVETKSTSFFAASQCGFLETEADDSFSSAKFSFDPSEVALNAAKFAKASADAKKINGGTREVIFDIRALHQLLQLFLPFNFSGESYRKKLTKISKGAEFASENISIIDDPLMANGTRPSEFDDEGFKSTRRRLVERGVVDSFLFDMRTAAKMKGEKAGNGARPAFTAQPMVSFSNISIEGGKEPDLVTDCRRGIFINSFLTSGANPVTGDFSFPLLIAFKVEGGEPTNAIKGAMMKGNFFGLMKTAQFERETAVYNGLRSGRMMCELEIIS
ncbi:MAG: TldD/PmbA family protein [Candidatus Micrarchaeota archaeon]